MTGRWCQVGNAAVSGLVGVIAISVAALIGLWVWHWSDQQAEARAWRQLRVAAAGATRQFDPSMVAGLPSAARRYFLYTIQPGVPLRTAAEIRMHGELGLGTKERPNYMKMRAEQILVAPLGFIWHVTAGRGLVRFAGSDGATGDASWSKFWLLGTVPVARAGGNADHARSAFGRYIAEAAFWTPAALLPQQGVTWSEVDSTTARVEISFRDMRQAVDVTVADSGQPVQVAFPRWSNANPEKRFRIQPFGGYLYDFRQFDGYMLPTRVEAGNLFGTDGYFPFFRACVDEIHFVEAGPTTPV